MSGRFVVPISGCQRPTIARGGVVITDFLVPLGYCGTSECARALAHVALPRYPVGTVPTAICQIRSVSLHASSQLPYLRLQLLVIMQCRIERHGLVHYECVFGTHFGRTHFIHIPL